MENSSEVKKYVLFKIDNYSVKFDVSRNDFYDESEGLSNKKGIIEKIYQKLNEDERKNLKNMLTTIGSVLPH